MTLLRDVALVDHVSIASRLMLPYKLFAKTMGISAPKGFIPSLAKVSES